MDELEFIPDEMKTSEMYEEIAKKHPKPFSLLNSIPSNLITPQIYIELVKKDGQILEKIPEEMKTKEICLEAIKNGGKLKFVPKELRNSEIYIYNINIFVNQALDADELDDEEELENGISKYFNNIPAEMKSNDFWKKLIGVNGYFLKYVPEEIKTKDLCLEAVKKFPHSIEHIPKKFITSEFYLEIAKENGDILKRVPSEMISEQMCIEAVRNNEYSIKYVPEEFKTSDVYLELVKHKYTGLKDVPKEKRTWKICLYTIEKNNAINYEDIPSEISSDRNFWEELINKKVACAIKYAPAYLVTPEICMEAVTRNPYNIKHIPKEKRTWEICYNALISKNENGNEEINEYLIKEVPEELRMNILTKVGFRSIKELLDYIPEEHRTNDFYIRLLRYGDDGIKHIPENYINDAEFWEKAIEEEGENLEYVPSELKTLDMCKKALKNSWFRSVIQYVPDNMKTKEIYEFSVKERYKLPHGYGMNLLENIPNNMITPEMYAMYIDAKRYNIEEDAMNTLLKIYKFDKICHFIPSLNVIKKYPQDQIEKFNKKIWWYLTRNDLYNLNDNTKNALVEAILSLGAFDKDDKQEERIGMIEHFATYMPKKTFDVYINRFNKEEQKIIRENFEISYHYKYVINSERLLKDPNFVNLFESVEEAKWGIEEIEYEILRTELSEKDMKKLMEKYSENIDRNSFLRYVLMTGYDKQVDEVNIDIILKTDLQELKNKNKKEGYALESKIRQIYYEANPDFMMTPEKLHKIFDGMDMVYKPEFYEFLKNNLATILQEPKKQLEISKIQKNWYDIVQANLGQKITFEKCENYIYGKWYNNVEYPEISKLSANCGYSQKDFETAQDIYKRQLERKESSIPQVEGKNGNSEYTYKVLRLDDPTAIFVGELTYCCQAVGNAGESCMIHSATSPNGRVLIVEDKNGKVLSQSWIWRNKNVICFDNIEAVEKDSNNKKIVSSEILETVKKAAKAFVEADKVGMARYEKTRIEELNNEKENGEITEEEYEEKISAVKKIVKGQQLSRVTVGIGYTNIDLSGLKKDSENRYPEEEVEYIDDSRKQLILYEDESVEHEDTDINTVSLYSDDDKTTNVIDVDTSEFNYDEENEYDEEFNNNEEQEENDDGYIDLGDITTVINHPQNRAKARKALENIKKYLKTKDKEER